MKRFEYVQNTKIPVRGLKLDGRPWSEEERTLITFKTPKSP